MPAATLGSMVGPSSKKSGYTIKNRDLANESVEWTGPNGPDEKRGNSMNRGTPMQRDKSVMGPFRAGVFATPESDRTRAGASYWGILDLSGNLTEFAAMIGNSRGRSFDGSHGQGKPVGQWGKAPLGLRGSGVPIGGHWGHWGGPGGQRVSNRAQANRPHAEGRGGHFSAGFRAVRTAPAN